MGHIPIRTINIVAQLPCFQSNDSLLMDVQVNSSGLQRSHIPLAIWIHDEFAVVSCFQLVGSIWHAARWSVTPPHIGTWHTSLLGLLKICSAASLIEHVVSRSLLLQSVCTHEVSLPLEATCTFLSISLPCGTSVMGRDDHPHVAFWPPSNLQRQISHMISHIHFVCHSGEYTTTDLSGLNFAGDGTLSAWLEMLTEF